MVRLKGLGEQYLRYGYQMLYGLLSAEWLVINRKQAYRATPGTKTGPGGLVQCPGFPSSHPCKTRQAGAE